MSHDEKDDENKSGKIGPTDKSERGSERAGRALSKTGLESSQVGRKIVGQGKRRETLKKWIKEQD